MASCGRLPTALSQRFRKAPLFVSRPKCVSTRRVTMFEQATPSSANAGRRAWTTGLGFAGEAAFVAFIALAPIIWPEVLPKPQALLMLLTPPAPVPPPTDVVVKPRATHAPITPMRFTLPTHIPTSIANVAEEPPTVANVAEEPPTVV